jgi:hypothetical protein
MMAAASIPTAAKPASVRCEDRVRAPHEQRRTIGIGPFRHRNQRAELAGKVAAR